jgi:hypothetical protein
MSRATLGWTLTGLIGGVASLGSWTVREPPLQGFGDVVRPTDGEAY